MAYITTPGFAGVDLTETGTDQLFPLGTEVNASDGNTYIYVQAGEATSQYYTYIISEDGQTTPVLTTTSSGVKPTKVGIPQQAIANGSCGWVVTKGLSFTTRTSANCATDVKIYTTAGGTFDDDSTATDLIQGARVNVAPGGSVGNVNTSSVGILETNSQD